MKVTIMLNGSSKVIEKDEKINSVRKKQFTFVKYLDSNKRTKTYLKQKDLRR